MDKSTEFYIAADHLNTTGGYKASQANGFTSQTEFGLGMRYKF
jgi:predicted porin